MRFGLVHRLLTDTLAALGLLALISSGELHWLVAAVLVVGLGLAFAVPESWQDRVVVKRFGVAAPLILLVVQLTRLLLGAEVLDVSVEFAAGLQVLRLATRRGAAHDQQVIVLALLHLIAGTVLGGGLSYGLCFLGFLVIAPGALVLSHLRREVEGNYRQGARDRTGLPVDVPRILRSRRVIGKPFLVFTCLLSVPIFLSTAALFLLFPRVGLSLLLLPTSRTTRMVGFSDRVDLGGVGKLRLDPTIVMRVHYPGLPDNPPPRLALYLRGTAFDHYDGRAWSRTVTQRRPTDGPHVMVTRPAAPDDRVLTISLDPIDPPVVFLPRDVVAFEVQHDPSLLQRPPRVYAGPEDQFQYSSFQERGLNYKVYLGTRPDPVRLLSDADRSRYLTLPPDLPPRVASLAAEWTRTAATPHQRAKQIEAKLRAEYRYDLDSPSGGAANPLDHFLFESKRGHCEFYSTAMAVLLRTQGIPARNVTGFVGATYNRFAKYYAVRQADAHSWVEAYIDGVGWVRFDATPPASAMPPTQLNDASLFVRELLEAASLRWNRHVENYDLHQQVYLIELAQRQLSGPTTTTTAPSRIATLIVGLLVLAVSAYLLVRARRSGPRGELPPSDPHRVSSLEVVALYRSLEAALAAQGIPRQPSTPPLAHANTLVALGHPLANEVLALTTLYLEARFGGRLLSDSERRAYSRRIRALRSAPKTPALRRAA